MVDFLSTTRKKLEKKRSERQAARKEGGKENLKGNFYGLLTVTESLKREALRLFLPFPDAKEPNFANRSMAKRTNERTRDRGNSEIATCGS